MHVVISCLGFRIQSNDDTQFKEKLLVQYTHPSMNIIPCEIIELIMNFTTREDLVLFSKLNKACHEICNRLPYKLRILYVDYKDENSFIYKYNKVNIKDYKKNGTYDYQKIYDLYLQNTELKEIHCACMGITSVPILPKMTVFYGFYNELTSFPIQPKMQVFDGGYNQLISFHIQPCLTRFIGDGNQLSGFPVQPKMTVFHGHNNKLTSFPIQPCMLYFNGNNNQLTSFPIQPKMTEFYGRNNQLISFPIQPKMTEFYGNSNQLTSFPIQPNMTDFYGNDNQLTSFPIQPKLITCKWQQ